MMYVQVASMDGCASQYIAHLSAQNCREEMVFSLRDAMVALLTQFKTRNGKMPAHIIIFRDGVSDGQFNLVRSTLFLGSYKTNTYILLLLLLL